MAEDDDRAAERDGRTGLTVERIVRAAIAVADAEGLPALSMRRLAVELDAGAMSLYRHVRGRAALTALMTEEVFGEIRHPAPGPRGWRARLELAARQERAMYRRHPWVLGVVAMTARPPLGPKVLAAAEWVAASGVAAGLSPVEARQVYVTLSDYVQGAALYELVEARARETSGVDAATWWQSRLPDLRALFEQGRFPTLAASLAGVAASAADKAVVSEEGFEFGLARVLDGVGVLVADRARGSAERCGEDTVRATPGEYQKVTPVGVGAGDTTPEPAPAPTEHRTASTEDAGRPLDGPTAAALATLGRRWVPEILYVLHRGGARFVDLLAAVPGLSRRVLSERLVLLTEEGLVERRAADGSPPRADYRLTARGRELDAVFQALDGWAAGGDARGRTTAAE
ncbi:winged helix-turn-helix transcriptional regulator [Actinoalloteichus spitiensis]|uniref:winged helix-turn-helix transcriptional regulator n=1 Tax=Actinoalloteichus spitiensis TaxID=252394 RepID=UPI000366B4BD|nr:winged helix-turn-helix transcriptional regulator [Actinoalloteichus spitiensis]